MSNHEKQTVDWRPSNAFLTSDGVDEEDRCDNLSCSENCSLDSSKTTRLSESEAERDESDTEEAVEVLLRCFLLDIK